LPVPVRRSPEKRVKLSAAFTPMGSVTISRLTVRRSRRTTVNAIRIVQPLSRVTAAVTSAVTTRTGRVTSTGNTTAARTASTDNVTPGKSKFLAAFATTWGVCSTSDAATTNDHRAEIRTTETARVMRPNPVPKRQEPVQTSADITTPGFDDVSTIRPPARTTPGTLSATDTAALISRQQRAPISEDIACGRKVNTDDTCTRAITTNSTAFAG